jgi:hypothetical protein
MQLAAEWDARQRHDPNDLSAGCARQHWQCATYYLWRTRLERLKNRTRWLYNTGNTDKHRGPQETYTCSRASPKVTLTSIFRLPR